MKIRISLFAFASLFSAWLGMSYFGNCVAEDYPGLSIQATSPSELDYPEMGPTVTVDIDAKAVASK